MLILITRTGACPASRQRPGTVLPLLAVCLVALLGFVALAVDIGMLILAKTQAQGAADLASLSAARALDATVVNFNQSGATSTAQAAMSYNTILGQQIQSSQLSLTFGSYDYDQTTQTFNTNFPATQGVPLSAVSATVTSPQSKTAFAGVFGYSFLPTVSASATAVHRPRDVALVMDLSTSMRFGTLLGFDFYTPTRSTNNPDPTIPAYMHYSANNANMKGPNGNRTSGASNYTISPTNTTVTNASYAQTYVNSFYQNNAFTTPLIRAFDSYSSSDGGLTWTAPTTQLPQLPPASYGTTPGGDVPLLKKNSTTVYATQVLDILGGPNRNPSWELDGYSNFTNGTQSNAAQGQSNYASAPFYGYTQGPAYYGKTFFIWPPDPRQPLSTANNSAQIQQFLTDFGYTNTDFNGAATGPALKGIYGTTATTGSQNWPWPNDGGTTLSTYLTNNVFIPGGARKLQTTDPQYQQIMRLYNWNYVVDNVGTTPCDWRVRFFGTNDNTALFSSTGWNLPSASTYTINYNEILRWITQTPNPFPTQLRAGRIKYYGSIPTAITGTYPNYGSKDQRFWKEFIDYVLGVYQINATTYQDISAMAGYGSDFTWGSMQLSAPPGNSQYMNYKDDPPRPRLRTWFGPMMMVDYLHNCNFAESSLSAETGSGPWFQMTPGDGYEAPLYSGKQGFLGAINTMQTNHPNDWFTTIFYGWPRQSATDVKSHNCVNAPLGTNYAYAKSAMFFPFSTINADGSSNNTEVTPYDADPATGAIPSSNFVDVARGDGDTCFDMALMLAYNQFITTPKNDTALRTYVTGTPITFPGGMAGGMGRKGAQKVIIFETDGCANCTASVSSMTSAPAYAPAQYYPIRYNMNNPSASEYPTIAPTYIGDPAVANNIQQYVTQLATDHGSARNPFRLYGLGFGPVFSGPLSSTGTQMLQNMQYWAGTQSSPNTALDPSQIITGTDAQMTTNMTNAYTNILQNGIQIALVK
jgi:hypothetical protein